MHVPSRPRRLPGACATRGGTIPAAACGALHDMCACGTRRRRGGSRNGESRSTHGWRRRRGRSGSPMQGQRPRPRRRMHGRSRRGVKAAAARAATARSPPPPRGGAPARCGRRLPLPTPAFWRSLGAPAGRPPPRPGRAGSGPAPACRASRQDQAHNCAFPRPPMQTAPFRAKCGDGAPRPIAPVRRRATPPCR